MEEPTYDDITDPAELAVMLVHRQAPETRLLPIAARPVADHSEYQQVNRIGRDGAALKGGWTFLVNTRTRTVLRTVGDPNPYSGFSCNCQETAPPGSPVMSEEINRGLREGHSAWLPGLPAPTQPR